MSKQYESTWDSLSRHQTPQWLKDAKLGIYTHWGPYSVPAYGTNGSWYPHNMYIKGTDAYNHHRRTYGPQEKFGYKDFIPMFTAEKFDADEWVELFKNTGAKFAGPVAEHHDGFSMWDSKVNSKWNAAKMGPKRDIVGQLRDSVRANEMKFVTTFHHAFQWYFFPTWDKTLDCGNPEYRDLYTGPHGEGENDILRHKEAEILANPFLKADNEHSANRSRSVAFANRHGQHQRPNKWFLDRWLKKLIEVTDNYQPDLMWFDFCLSKIEDSYRREFVAYYYNKGVEWGRDVDILYKESPANNFNLPPGAGTLDLEVGNLSSLSPNVWVTDTSVDTSSGKAAGWSHVTHLGFKSGERLVHNLIDVVSKHGVMLLNVGPRADGSIPERAQVTMRELGAWLEINGEAIYGSVPWITSGEGPTVNVNNGHFAEENEPRFTAVDFRFTTKGRNLYAICMGQPGDESIVCTMALLYQEEVKSVTLLGKENRPLKWKLTEDGLHIQLPTDMPYQHAYVYRIEHI
ncbi:MAG: alpha-L-fucosidase [Rhizobiales bacterium]|nr:alpha-L-fucosidase [Hyphomicrobiales bacterium]NRB13650.1 alpha-L-fucosidase [Hyphomicrobiales bacterium]